MARIMKLITIFEFMHQQLVHQNNGHPLSIVSIITWQGILIIGLSLVRQPMSPSASCISWFPLFKNVR